MMTKTQPPERPAGQASALNKQQSPSQNIKTSTSIQTVKCKPTIISTSMILSIHHCLLSHYQHLSVSAPNVRLAGDGGLAVGEGTGEAGNGVAGGGVTRQVDVHRVRLHAARCARVAVLGEGEGQAARVAAGSWVRGETGNQLFCQRMMIGSRKLTQRPNWNADQMGTGSMDSESCNMSKPWCLYDGVE